ncbi:glycosyltransferase family 2 protein [Roseomonas sp. SSH11]|uniref:Glycosyltransferase family 2 protein n=1 Tax=Pararoseomonas baculiformis TaxID=2820812 RepID=A0ABS4ADQ8_9PROT|nr:glycosyltransferase [Pararoseomonas baculiformis]MBP0445128.1 glycosyltransferase family 2 protein [Pararoseomonas baculiformis]
MILSPVSVAIFAYNEEAAITASLDALAALAGEAELQVHVLINGCTDGTERVVRSYVPQGFTLHPVVIARGDKANAWNTYVHEVAPADAAAHVFTDGDMLAAPGSIAGFLERFAAEPEANGCAALPISGRSRDAFRAKLVRNREMAGNLYALRGEAVAAFRQRGLRLPFGMFGEDGLVTTLIKHDLDTRGPRNDRRVTATERGGFAYPPLSPWSLRDWRIYRNRRMRYAVRRQQANMLYPLLFERGVEAMPEHVVDLYREHHAAMEVRWNGLDTWFDRLARKRILRDVARADAAKQEERAHLYS